MKQKADIKTILCLVAALLIMGIAGKIDYQLEVEHEQFKSVNIQR